MTAKKETVKKTAEKTIKNEVKEVKEIKKETIKKVPPKKESAGKQIRTLFEAILPKLTNEQLEILTSQEKTKEVLKIRYAFIKEVTENKDDRKINGNARYGAKQITINGKSYWICNDLYERNIETFKKWCESLK